MIRNRMTPGQIPVAAAGPQQQGMTGLLDLGPSQQWGMGLLATSDALNQLAGMPNTNQFQQGFRQQLLMGQMRDQKQKEQQILQARKAFADSVDDPTMKQAIMAGQADTYLGLQNLGLRKEEMAANQDWRGTQADLDRQRLGLTSRGLDLEAARLEQQRSAAPDMPDMFGVYDKQGKFLGNQPYNGPESLSQARQMGYVVGTAGKPSGADSTPATSFKQVYKMTDAGPQLVGSYRSDDPRLDQFAGRDGYQVITSQLNADDINSTGLSSGNLNKLAEMKDSVVLARNLKSRVAEGLKSGDFVGGTVGAIATLGNSLQKQAQAVARRTGDDVSLDPSTYTDFFAETAAADNKVQSALISLAYMRAKMLDPGGRVSDADLKANMKTMGFDTNDPAIINERVLEAVEDIETGYASRVSTFGQEGNDRFSIPQPTQPTVDEKDPFGILP